MKFLVFFILIFSVAGATLSREAQSSNHAYSVLSLISCLRVYHRTTIIENCVGHTIYLTSKWNTLNHDKAGRILQDQVEPLYIKYLRDIRVHLERESLAKLVESKLKDNVTDFNVSENTAQDVLQCMKMVGIKHILEKIKPADHVDQEIYKNALISLKTFAAVRNDYAEYILFPSHLYSKNIGLEECLKDMREFVTKSLGIIDFGATFADALLTLCLLNFIKYVALLQEDLKLLYQTDDLILLTNSVLDTMPIIFERSYTFLLPCGLVNVYVIKQARKGVRKMHKYLRQGNDGYQAFVSAAEVRSEGEALRVAKDNFLKINIMETIIN